MRTLPELVAEAYRLRLLGGLEELLADAGLGPVAGVDEAGRGCLAGPVVAAAAVMDPRRLVPGVDDSKRLPPERRGRLAAHVREVALAWSVAAVEPAVIDRTDILAATRRAMVQAVEGLVVEPEVVLVDAVSLPGLAASCLPVVRGETLSYSIACASILAKEARDGMMAELDLDYPQYGFARHKGYGAREHLEALAEYGPCPSHRLTFRSVLPRSAEI